MLAVGLSRWEALYQVGSWACLHLQTAALPLGYAAIFSEFLVYQILFVV